MDVILVKSAAPVVRCDGRPCCCQRGKVCGVVCTVMKNTDLRINADQSVCVSRKES